MKNALIKMFNSVDSRTAYERIMFMPYSQGLLYDSLSDITKSLKAMSGNRRFHKNFDSNSTHYISSEAKRALIDLPVFDTHTSDTDCITRHPYAPRIVIRKQTDSNEKTFFLLQIGDVTAGQTTTTEQENLAVLVYENPTVSMTHCEIVMDIHHEAVPDRYDYFFENLFSDKDRLMGDNGLLCHNLSEAARNLRDHDQVVNVAISSCAVRIDMRLQEGRYHAENTSLTIRCSLGDAPYALQDAQACNTLLYTSIAINNLLVVPKI